MTFVHMVFHLLFLVLIPPSAFLAGLERKLAEEAKVKDALQAALNVETVGIN